MTSGSQKKKRLGDLLVQEGLITPTQLERAVEVQREKGGRLGDILVDMKLCTEDLVLSALAKRADIPFVSSLDVYPRVLPDILALIPADMARRRNLIPLAREGRVLTVALADPFAELSAVDDLKIQTGFDIKVVLASEKEIRSALDRFYSPASGSSAPGASVSAGDAQMETIASALIENAVKLGAEHVFLEPRTDVLRVRYRVKGALQPRPDLPLSHAPALTAHLKTLARLDTTECWLPQDGRLRRVWEGREFNIKLTTLPTSLGEKIVLSILDSARALPLDLLKLGLEPDVLDAYRRLIESPRGLVVVAGPPGSGRTATLYATLNALNTPERHILTMEDPIERYLEGVTQLQTRADARMTLAGGVHVLRRQAPDVLMVSEIRDLDTAEAALDAAAECLVLTTLIASDSLGALHKLLDMGVAPSLLAARLGGVLAQRLVRRLCVNCRESHTASLRQLMAAGVGDKEIRGAKRAESFTLYQGRGCGQCLATGYVGATAVFELFPATEPLRRLIAERASPGLLARETAERVTLREAAVKRALAGETTIDEALRAL